MIKILFLIHDLGQGGAEKVLVNLVNNMDLTKFDITLMALFGGGINEQFLNKGIRYISIFEKKLPGNSHLMKLLSPCMLHKWLIKEKYDIEVSYLEGPSTRIISGCPEKKTRLVSWIHCTMSTQKEVAKSFRNYIEAEHCYNRMDDLVFVSESVKKSFLDCLNYSGKTHVLYNTVESEMIKEKALETAKEIKNNKCFKLISVGTLKEIKGFDRLLRIVDRLVKEQYAVHLYLLGRGPLEEEFRMFIKERDLQNNVTMLGYQINPFKYMEKCDLYVCSSYSEGFSTAVTEALIVGIPICTVNVSGMKEMLGNNNEYGVITENTDEALYDGIKLFLEEPERLISYRRKAKVRGMSFSTYETVNEVEKMFMEKLHE